MYKLFILLIKRLKLMSLGEEAVVSGNLRGRIRTSTTIIDQWELARTLREFPTLFDVTIRHPGSTLFQWIKVPCCLVTPQLLRGLPRVVFGLFEDSLFEKWRKIAEVPFC